MVAMPHAPPPVATVAMRRAFAVFAAATLLVVGLRAGLPGAASLGGTGQAPATSGMAPIAAHGHVVQPGDSLWSIARRIQPEGDVRPLVARLAAERQGRPLQAGEYISIP